MANGSTPLTWFAARMAGPLRGICSVPIRRHRNAARRMSSVQITVMLHQGSLSTHERKQGTLTAGIDAMSPRSHKHSRARALLEPAAIRRCSLSGGEGYGVEPWERRGRSFG